MYRFVTLTLVASLSTLSLGCDKPSDGGKPAASSTATAAAKPKQEYEEVKNDKLGYSIKLPKGAKTTMADANGGSYGWDTMMILVHPTAEPLASADDVQKGVVLGEAKPEKATEGDLFLVTLKVDKGPYDVAVGKKGTKFIAQCKAEPDHKEIALEVCKSIKAL